MSRQTRTPQWTSKAAGDRVRLLARLGAEPLGRLTLTVQETAEILGVHPKAIYARCKSGELDSMRIGRSIRVPARAVRELLGDDV